jgi:hypothetical protein
MSLLILSTKTPKDFFGKHQLVLHVGKAEMSKVRVFQVTRESHPGLHLPSPALSPSSCLSCPSQGSTGHKDP